MGEITPWYKKSSRGMYYTDPIKYTISKGPILLSQIRTVILLPILRLHSLLKENSTLETH